MEWTSGRTYQLLGEKGKENKTSAGEKNEDRVRARPCVELSPLVNQRIKTESTRKSSNIYLSWTKIEYQNNLNPIALFSTLNKR